MKRIAIILSLIATLAIAGDWHFGFGGDNIWSPSRFSVEKDMGIWKVSPHFALFFGEHNTYSLGADVLYPINKLFFSVGYNYATNPDVEGVIQSVPFGLHYYVPIGKFTFKIGTMSELNLTFKTLSVGNIGLAWTIFLP